MISTWSTVALVPAFDGAILRLDTIVTKKIKGYVVGNKVVTRWFRIHFRQECVAFSFVFNGRVSPANGRVVLFLFIKVLHFVAPVAATLDRYVIAVWVQRICNVVPKLIASNTL